MVGSPGHILTRARTVPSSSSRNLPKPVITPSTVASTPVGAVPTPEIYARRRAGCFSVFVVFVVGVFYLATRIFGGGEGGASSVPVMSSSTVTDPGPVSGSGDTTSTTLFVSPTLPPPTYAPGAPKIQIYGDSLATGYGTALEQYAQDVGYQADMATRGSSGLTRPEFFDWPNHLNVWLNNDGARLVVFGVGANDAQPITVDGQKFDVTSPEWSTEYSRRVREMIDLVSSRGKQLIWVGTPDAKEEGFRNKLSILRDATRAAVDAAAADGIEVRYYDTWSQFVGPNERGDDGFHLNQKASRVLGDSLLGVVKEMLPLEVVP